MTKQEGLAIRVDKARRIAKMGLCSITSRDRDGKAKTVTVPGSEGKRYQVIIKRRNGYWTTECRLECGPAGYKDCLGNSITVCYHSFAAIFAAGLDNGCRVHSVTESLKAAGRLKRLVKKAVIKSLRSRQNESIKWFQLVVIPKKSARQDVIDLFGPE
jgi:hypothetical protein